jgi:aminobenzoyl-glutamate utilization protein B
MFYHNRMKRPCLLVFFVFPAIWAQTTEAARARILRSMDDTATVYNQLSRRIWEFAEVGYKETRSAGLLRTHLRTAGFRITENIGGVSTAFVAEWGSGKPVVGIMGVYDALPGLSQDTTPERKALAANAPGHGCGHNLLGTAAVNAAVTVKNYLEQNRLPGTVRFYGTPAEEGGGGKIYMARAGAFDGVDSVLTWHPGSSNYASLTSTLANITVKFRYHGRPAHASVAPEKGRSALDAVTLMNVAVEMLREHVPRETRLHYIITRGGASPNIVPDLAETYYYVRHPRMAVLDGIWQRVMKCAEAGALATETRLEVEFINSVWEVLPNDTLGALLDKNLRHSGGVKYTAEELAFAEALYKTLESPGDPVGTQETIRPMSEARELGGSTDVGDISWLVPTAQFSAATFVPGTPPHTWQSTACSGMSIGQKGMLVAAKTLALSAIDIFHDPKLAEAARASFEKRRAGVAYRSRIPEGQKPPLNYRDTQ